jgi:ethanolamine utilization protein EutN
MRIAKILGSVTLNRPHPTMVGGRLRLAAALTQEELRAGADPAAETFVVWDDLGAGVGSLIAVSEGAEAAAPFRPDAKPIDAYCAAILDNLHLP